MFNGGVAVLDVGSNCRAMLAPGLHMFLQENADGMWTLCIKNSISISPPWPLCDSLGSVLSPRLAAVVLL